MNVIGYVNQIETMGNVDGPGTRFVIFLQGCSLRCDYCHNPETIEISRADKYEKSSDQIISQIESLKGFYQNGGVTISGGEPLLQMDFIIDLAIKIKKLGLHVTIDTSGAPFNLNNELFKVRFDKLMKYVDLFMVDIKHMDDDVARKLTSQSSENSRALIKYLEENEQEYWIRYVLVPTISDNESDLLALRDFVSDLKVISNFEILPYHDLAKAKWEMLNENYKLSNIRPATTNDVNKAYKKIFTT